MNSLRYVVRGQSILDFDVYGKIDYTSIGATPLTGKRFAGRKTKTNHCNCSLLNILFKLQEPITCFKWGTMSLTLLCHCFTRYDYDLFNYIYWILGWIVFCFFKTFVIFYILSFTMKKCNTTIRKCINYVFKFVLLIIIIITNTKFLQRSVQYCLFCCRSLWWHYM
jgi:hypothetical protein